MAYSVKERLTQLKVEMNPKTQKEVERRWKAIMEMRENLDSKNLGEASICLVNTAGKNQI